MVAGIVVTHGNLAEELLKTARSVYGEFDGCYAVTNDCKSPQVVFEEIEGILNDIPDESAMVFIDFAGGSCSHPSLRLEHERDNLRVIAGVNLPMIVAFLNKRGEVPFDNLADEIIKRSHDSIKELDSNNF